MGFKDRAQVIKNRLDAEYQHILDIQNSGAPCPSCGSVRGHFLTCGLLNRNVAEAQSAAKGDFTEADHICARGLGIDLDTPDNR